VKGAKRNRRYPHSLPVYTVESVEEASALIERVGTLTWIEGAPAFVIGGVHGDVTKLDGVIKLIGGIYKVMKAGGKL